MKRTRPDQFNAMPLNATPKPLTSRSLGTSFFSRSGSLSGILAIKTAYLG